MRLIEITKIVQDIRPRSLRCIAPRNKGLVEANKPAIALRCDPDLIGEAPLKLTRAQAGAPDGRTSSPAIGAGRRRMAATDNPRNGPLRLLRRYWRISPKLIFCWRGRVFTAGVDDGTQTPTVGDGAGAALITKIEI
jgi:hypothetical protein